MIRVIFFEFQSKLRDRLIGYLQDAGCVVMHVAESAEGDEAETEEAAFRAFNPDVMVFDPGVHKHSASTVDHSTWMVDHIRSIRYPKLPAVLLRDAGDAQPVFLTSGPITVVLRPPTAESLIAAIRRVVSMTDV
jgi:DNA-binding response OmpR family regulator